VWRIEPGVRRFIAWTLVLSTLVTLGVAAQQHYRTTRKLQDPLGGHINDFDRWMLMTPRLVDKRVDYINDELPTPPVTLIVLAPFTALSRPAAQFLWVCLKLPLALLVFGLAAGIVARTGVRLTPPAMALMLACWWLPVVLDMQEGQTNFLALLPLVAGLYVVQGETLLTEGAAGFLIGLASAVKVTPLVFVAYFVWKRRWVVALSAAASVAVWSIMVPALVFGWDQNLRWLERWMQIMILPFARGEIMYPGSQSFGSFAMRLLARLPAFYSNRNGMLDGHYMNVMALGPGVVYQLVRAVAIVVALCGLVWMRQPLATLRSRRYLVETGAVAAFMLWFSERTWVHHYVSFILTLAVAGAILSDGTVPVRSRRAVRAAMILCAVAGLFASDAGRLFGRDGVDWAQAAGVFLWPSVLVTYAIVWATTASRLPRSTANLGDVTAASFESPRLHAGSRFGGPPDPIRCSFIPASSG
jgi:hypothetical protein